MHPMPQNPSDRRTEPRLPVDFQLAVHSHYGHFEATARDVSLTGLYFEFHKEPPEFLSVGHKVYMVFALNDQPWTLSAITVHCDRNGAGVLFLAPNPDLYGACASLAPKRRRFFFLPR